MSSATHPPPSQPAASLPAVPETPTEATPEHVVPLPEDSLASAEPAALASTSIRAPPPARRAVSMTIRTPEHQRSLPDLPANGANTTPLDTSVLQYDPYSIRTPSLARRTSAPPPVRPVPVPGSGQRPVTFAEAPEQWAVHGDILAREYPPGSVGARLKPTLAEALEQRGKSSWQASWTMYSINIAIALQILLGALTTALGASLRGNSIRVSIAVLGSMSTLVASYLARTRGSNEPETSMIREHALSHYIRSVNAFILDHGHDLGHNQRVDEFRGELERLLHASDPNARRSVIFDPEAVVGSE
ncbi:hypothetical protein BC834DRAFT_974500 [Gloeopeniophorella convolvens]|nr:hypothetical protein BC834DRAFT_974500 [Gloeopeniophorella convolvens]